MMCVYCKRLQQCSGNDQKMQQCCKVLWAKIAPDCLNLKNIAPNAQQGTYPAYGTVFAI